jgi:uncharacterized membrane protein YfcA
MEIQYWQWALGAVAGCLLGVSKTGIPGLATPVVPLLAAVFGGRPSVGIMLLMLICGDCFAVAWYRRHARWERLLGLLPWVVVGMGMGAATLWFTGRLETDRDYVGMLIGVLVLLMVALHLLEHRIPEQLTPKSAAGVAFTGAAAGFATTVANAAGPVMAIYLLAHRLSKQQFMGTIAWYFFIINLTKVPVYVALTALDPQDPVITMHSLAFVLRIVPAIVAGAITGRWLLPRISQRGFDAVVLALAVASALYVIARSL